MQNEKEIYFFLPDCTHCFGSSAIQRFSLNNVNCCNLPGGAITINLPEDMNNLLYSLKGTDKFVECENYRVMCDTLENHDTCTENKICK